MSIALQDGATFANRYQIVRCIAAGGMGAVYEVVHLETERRRALKVMLPHILGSQELRDRFKREAKVAAQIESEHIVDVFDAGLDEATQMPFLVMELLKGEELGKRLDRVGKFPPHEVYTYLWQTSLALDKTHKASIVHRDLKPENLFLCDSESGAPKVKVLDFGIAKLVADGSTQANATRSVGTPLYMSPEQFKSGVKVSPASDIYALGMMAYTLLVGEPYWADEAASDTNVFAFAATVMNGPQEPATARAMRRHVALPPAFDVWFRRVCAVNPTERFPTATQAIAALGELYGLPPLGKASGLSGTDPHGGVAPNAYSGSSPGIPSQVGTSQPGAPMGTAGSGVAVSSAAIAMTGGATKKSGAGVAIAIVMTALVAICVGAAIFFRGRAASNAPTAATTGAPATAEAPAATPTPETKPASTAVEHAAPTAPVASTATAAADASPSATSVPSSTSHAAQATEKKPAAGKPTPPTKATTSPASPSQPTYSRD